MRRYYQDDQPSIGQMLMQAGLGYAQMIEQQKAREQQGLANAINLMGALKNLPEGMRTDQGVLKGIDETLGQMTKGKFKLPKVSEQSLSKQWEEQSKGTPGGMTPIAEMRRGPQIGEYAPIAEEQETHYGLDRGSGQMKALGKLPRGAKVHDYTGATEKPLITFNTRTGKYEQAGVVPPGGIVQRVTPLETPEERFARERPVIDYRTGKQKEIIDYREQTGPHNIEVDENGVPLRRTRDKYIQNPATKPKEGKEPLPNKQRFEFGKALVEINTKYADMRTKALTSSDKQKVEEEHKKAARELIDTHARRIVGNEWDKWKKSWERAKKENRPDIMDHLRQWSIDKLGLDPQTHFTDTPTNQ